MSCSHKVIVKRIADDNDGPEWSCEKCFEHFLPAEKPECVCRPCHRYGDANPAGGMICECLCHPSRPLEGYTYAEIDESFGRFFDRHEKEEREFRKGIEERLSRLENDK